jgi:hypothetical protein
MTKIRGIILLEGADCSGKTTLARHLVDAYGARYLHGRVFKDMWRSHVAMVRLALRWADEGLVVIDRLWLSELIYGQIYRGGPSYDLGARCLDRVLQRTGTVTVLCAPRDQRAQLVRHADRAALGGEAFTKIQDVVALYADLRDGNVARPGDGYLGQLTRFCDYTTRRDVVVYDLDTDGGRLKRFGAALVAQVEALRVNQLPAALRSDKQNLTGNLTTATVLLVGDHKAIEACAMGPRGPRWPFCWHDGRSDATWLNAALHAIAHDETTTLITNAHYTDDYLPKLLACPLRVVALGHHAEDRLRALGHVPDARVKHPPHYQRFYHAELADYAARLRIAIRGTP